MKNAYGYTTTSPSTRSAWQRMLAIAATLFCITLLSACATATGPKFSGIAQPAADQGDVYFYRTGAFTAGGAAFDVFLDGKQIDSLSNASYLHLRLKPGTHTLKVNPSMMGKISERVITVKAGKTSFYQYNFVTGLMANSFFIGASIEPRAESVALEALKELQAVK